jgi:hypothetical protein
VSPTRRAVVTHLSKYAREQCCLAAYDQYAERFIRLRTGAGQYDFPYLSDLCSGGRTCRIGDVIQFADTDLASPPPHRENRYVDPGAILRVGELTSDELAALLGRVAAPGLAAAFDGTPVVGNGGSCCFVGPERSLGVLRAPHLSTQPVLSEVLSTPDGPKAKLCWHCDGLQIRSGMDDIRYLDAGYSPDDQALQLLNTKVADVGGAFVSLSLTTPYRGSHWMLIAAITPFERSASQ